MLTISIWFSTLLCFTIFSIFCDYILLMIFSRLLSWLVSSSRISFWVTSLFVFLRRVVNILVLLSTISLCLRTIRFEIDIDFCYEFSFVDHIVCMANFSRVYLSYYGTISSTISIFWLHFFWNTINKLSRCYIILLTYSIRISSPVMTIFYFFFFSITSIVLTGEISCV